MNPGKSDVAFSQAIPQIYESHLVPLIFESYAADMATRVAEKNPVLVLEVAAGTGVVTRALATTLPVETKIVATDLNKAMLDRAAAKGTSRAVEWRPADALQLPFADESCDVVVCQFGAMFFPDKAKAFAEIRRVLRRAGHFLFNVWDRIEENEFADTITKTLAALYPENPPRFLARTPHGYHDVKTIARDLTAGGFEHAPKIVTLTQRSRAASPHIPAVGYCQGTPLRAEIEAYGAATLTEATDAAAATIRDNFGAGSVDGKIQAHVVTVRR
jgi:SAM-dependent methyltransferase